jgi:hypothetical protein
VNPASSFSGLTLTLRQPSILVPFAVGDGFPADDGSKTMTITHAAWTGMVPVDDTALAANELAHCSMTQT